MDDLLEVEERAADLRARFSALIEDLGEFAPPFRELRAELAHIDESIESLSALNGSSGFRSWPVFVGARPS